MQLIHLQLRNSIYIYKYMSYFFFFHRKLIQHRQITLDYIKKGGENSSDSSRLKLIKVIPEARHAQFASILFIPYFSFAPTHFFVLVLSSELLLRCGENEQIHIPQCHYFELRVPRLRISIIFEFNGKFPFKGSLFVFSKNWAQRNFAREKSLTLAIAARICIARFIILIVGSIKKVIPRGVHNGAPFAFSFYLFISIYSHATSKHGWQPISTLERYKTNWLCLLHSIFKCHLVPRLKKKKRNLTAYTIGNEIYLYLDTTINRDLINGMSTQYHPINENVREPTGPHINCYAIRFIYRAQEIKFYR